jgi:hypothetical protein
MHSIQIRIVLLASIKKEILNNQQAQADGLCLLKILHVIVMVSLQTACFKQVQQVRR